MERSPPGFSKFDDPEVGPKGTKFECGESVKIAEIYYAADRLEDFFRWANRALHTGHDRMGDLFDIYVELIEQGITDPRRWALTQPVWW